MAQCVPGRIQDAAGATTEGQRVEWRGGTALMGCTSWLRGWLRLRIGRGHAMAPARGQRRGGGGGRLRVCKPPPSLAREGRAADSPAGQFDGLRRTHPLCAVSSSSPGLRIQGPGLQNPRGHGLLCAAPGRTVGAAVAASLSREGAVNADRSPRPSLLHPLHWQGQPRLPGAPDPFRAPSTMYHSSAPLLPPPSPYLYFPCVRLHCTMPCYGTPRVCVLECPPLGRPSLIKLVLVKKINHGTHILRHTLLGYRRPVERCEQSDRSVATRSRRRGRTGGRRVYSPD